MHNYIVHSDYMFNLHYGDFAGMTIEELEELTAQHPEVDIVSRELGKSKGKHLLLSGLHASARSMLLAAIKNDELRSKSGKAGRTILIVMDNADEAQYMYSDLRTLTTSPSPSKGGDVQVCFFPVSHRRRQGVDEALAIQRTETLSHCAMDNATSPSPSKGGDVLRNEGGGLIIVSYPEAIIESVPAPKALEDKTLYLRTGEEIQVSRLGEMLTELGFERVDFVYEPGQYAIRGGIVDVYSYSHDDPYRIDFFGDEIDSIRYFDIETQLSKDKTAEIDIVGPTSQGSDEKEYTIADYVGEDTIWVSNDFGLILYKISGQVGNNTLRNSDLGDTLKQRLAETDTIEIGEKSYFGNYSRIEFDTLPQPAFNKNFDLLTDDLRAKIREGYRLYILADQKKQTDRLASIFESVEGEPIHFVAVDKTLHGGFVDRGLKICCYTDHEIFERFHRVSLTSENARRGKAIITLKEINQLQVGDYVVHSDHGIARFGGLVTTPVNGKPQEMIKLVFRDGDCVFVSIHNLHRISKYKGREGSEPTISKLGSGAWERLKERTKDKVKDIARDLIKLYATRKQQKGFAYTPDGYMQHELEASFLYEDTPDQAKATADIKRDMESPMPMDRLVCGDVGFGKTEVAMRAAFKAATDGKQVAVLVPTTVLALQHYNTFKERMKNFPVRIEYLSRGKSVKEVRELLADLETGKIDILIGTHKLVGKSVKWHDLGLLIIDEEQKFGVTVKDKLKSLRTNVDVLTLTATPIPRTLQFSLLGARDLSVMTTPPQNRYPVQTEVITPDDEDIIKEAIDLEMQRNGQIFIVNNRIEMLSRIERRIHALCPEARIVVAHGQMPTEEMEQRLEDFINYDYDILLSTTIIESGVDIPNVNTIIIYSAQHYGLADLHQLRGRVGRSNKKAYCYLVAPPRELLTDDARRRLDALSTFAELGAGFNLAMQDLDIRGAGNLLGAEQSGFIADLGYETYQRILNEAVQELKDELLSGDDEDEKNAELLLGGRSDEKKLWVQDSQLESDLPLGFPSEYVENISERISLYRELDSLRNEDQLTEYKKRMIDRFGPLPEQADELLNVVRLRWICCRLGVEKVLLKGGRLVLYFVQNDDRYWHSEAFGKIITFIVSRAQRCQLVEEKDKKGKPTGRRYATIMQVQTVAGAINLLSKVENEQ